jgi:hypothetical protein
VHVSVAAGAGAGAAHDDVYDYYYIDIHSVT